MKKVIASGTVLSFLGGIICSLLWIRFRFEAFFSLAVTFFTTFYHFIMRILVACAVSACRKNKDGSALSAVRLSRAERIFYDKIRIKKWKKFAPTYNPSLFSVKRNSLSELMNNMTNARISHEIIVVLSFLPLLFSKFIGGTIPFLITSVLSALFDMQFVLIQRYNTARLEKIMTKVF